jgi:hypothetical protein
MRRQWLMVGSLLAVVAIGIAAAWTVRDRFAPVEVGSRAPEASV